MTFSIGKKSVYIFILQILISVFVLIVWLLDIYTIKLVRGIFLTSLIIVLIYSLKYVNFPSLYHWFILVYISLYYLYPLFIPIFAPEINIDDRVMLSYTFIVVCGLHIFIISYEVFKNKFQIAPRENSIIVSPKRLEAVIITFILVNIVSIAIFILDAGSLNEIINATRLQRKTEATSLTILGIYLVNIGSILYLFAPAYISRNKKYMILFVVLLFSIDLIVFFVFRQRTPLIMHIIALGVGYYYVKPMLILKKGQLINSTIKVNYLKIGMLFALLILLATYLRFFRGQIESRSITEVDVRIEDSLLHSLTYGDLGYTPRITSILNTVPEKEQYLYGQSFYRFLFIPIPRALWKDKPENTQRIVASWLYPSKLEQTSPPGIQGDLYINFGYYGLFGFLIYGFVFARLDYKNTLLKYTVFSLSFTQIFHLVRGGFTNPVIVFIIIYILMMYIIKYLKTNRLDYNIWSIKK